MSSSIIFNVEHTPVQITSQIFNNIYQTNQTIQPGDLSMNTLIVDYIRDILHSSYMASASKLVVDTPNVNVVNVNTGVVSYGSILESIRASITPSSVQSIGSFLSTNHQRDPNAPFLVGDTFTFHMQIRPGSFTVYNDAPRETRDGIQFFDTTMGGIPVQIANGETVEISQWIFTDDTLNGPYYDGDATTGFMMNMAIEVVGPIVSYDYTFAPSWVLQPVELNNIYSQSSTSVVVDKDSNMYITFYSRSSSSSNSSDLVVAKFDMYGNLIWNTMGDFNFQNIANSAYREENPNIMISESTNQLIIAYMTMNPIHGGSDSKIIAVDKNTMSINWSYQGPEINSSNDDNVPELSLNVHDNTFVVVHNIRGNTSESGGAYQGTNHFYDDILFSKFDLAGNHLWTTHDISVNTSFQEVHPSIAIDTSGYIYIVYMSSGNVNNLGNEGSFDIFFAKASPAGDIVSIQKLTGVNTSAPDVVPTIRYSSYDNTLYMSHYRQGPFEIIITKITLNGDVIWTTTDTVNVDVINEYIKIDVDQENGMCVFSYSASPTRPGNYDIVIGAVDPDGNICYLEKPPILQSSSPEYNASVVVTQGGNLRIAYETEGSVNGMPYQGGRDIVVASLDKIYPNLN